MTKTKQTIKALNITVTIPFSEDIDTKNFQDRNVIETILEELFNHGGDQHFTDSPFNPIAFNIVQVSLDTVDRHSDYLRDLFPVDFKPLTFTKEYFQFSKQKQKPDKINKKPKI